MFNRNRLLVPAQVDGLRLFDLVDPAAPAALDDFDLGLDLEITSVARFDNGDLCLLDRGGRLVRATQAGSVVWNVESREADETPVQVAVDANGAVWVGMRGGKVAKFDSSGILQTRVEDTDNPIIQASDATFLVTYNDETGRVVLIDLVSASVLADYDLSQLSDEHDATPVLQIGARGEKFYLPARRKLTGVQYPGRYEILEVATDELLSVFPLQWPQALTGTQADADGRVWAMDEFVSIMLFRSDTSLEGIYSLESAGRLQALALSEDAGILYAVSDEILGSARVHALDPETGVATYLDYEGTAMTGGDLTGYQLATVVTDPDVDVDPPVVDSGLIEALIFPDQTVISGKPGSVLKGVSVTSSVGNATIQDDGSFAIVGATMAPATVTLTFTGPGGSTPTDVAADDHDEVVTAAVFHGTHFGLAGGHLQIALADGSGPLTTGTHYLRIKDLATGKYWNGESFVTPSGLWLQFTHRDMGLWSYLFEPQKAGDYAILFQENSVYGYDSVQVTSVPEDTAETLSQVKNMAAPGAALLAPTNLFNEETSIGGFLAGRLDRLQYLLNILARKATLIFPKAIEGIATVVSATSLKQGDTPLILFTIMDSVTGEGKDCTDHVVRLRCRAQAGGILIFDHQLEAVDEKTGQFQIRLTADDTATAGAFQAELVDTAPDGVVITTQNFRLDINRSLA